MRQETLEKYGAVSEQTASEMAIGIRNVSGTDLGVSVTGIAGPGGGTDEKPVGLVFTALAHKDGVIVKRLDLTGDRARIRNLTCLHVFDMVRAPSQYRKMTIMNSGGSGLERYRKTAYQRQR